MLYWNHQYYPTENHPFQPSGRAFQFGDGFFETFVFYEGALPTWSYHWERLTLASEALGFHLGDSGSWLDKITAILPSDAGTIRVRLTVWRTGSGLYIPDSNGFDWCLEWRPLGFEWLQQVQPVKLAGWYPFAMLTPGPWAGFKSLSSMPYVLAGRYQKTKHWDAILLLDHQCNAAEALGYNLFISDGDSLLTPPLDTGIVNGTLRRMLLQNHFGLKVREQHLSQEEVCGASEVWLTNITFGIRTVAEFCGRTRGVSVLAQEIQTQLAKDLDIL